MGSPHKMFLRLSTLLALLSSTSALTAVCSFRGEGTGNVTGDIFLTEHETPDGTEIEISGKLMNLSPGEHGFHIHENGDLSDNCKGASEEMIALVRIEDHLVKLSGATSVLSRAIVVHSGVDDLGLGGEEDSLTTGHAGARAACCVITEQ